MVECVKNCMVVGSAKVSGVELPIAAPLKVGALEDHVNEIASGEDLHLKKICAKCDVCDKEFSTFKLLASHNKKCEDRKEFNCPDCDASFNRLHNLKLHAALHQPVGDDGVPPKCPECSRAFPRWASFKCHLAQHELDDTSLCAICGDEFMFYTQLKRHLAFVHNQRHAPSPSLEQRLSGCCESENDASASKSDVNVAVAKTKLSKSKSSFCSWHCCKFCKKAFTRRSALDRHEVIHTGKRDYMCQICHQSFNQPGALKVHSAIHLEEKPFTCSLCGQGFTQRGNLRKHVRKLHPATVDASHAYACPVCTCVFTKLVALNVHVTRFHDTLFETPEKGKSSQLKNSTTNLPLPNCHGSPSSSENAGSQPPTTGAKKRKPKPTPLAKIIELSAQPDECRGEIGALGELAVEPAARVSDAAVDDYGVCDEATEGSQQPADPPAIIPTVDASSAGRRLVALPRHRKEHNSDKDEPGSSCGHSTDCVSRRHPASTLGFAPSRSLLGSKPKKSSHQAPAVRPDAPLEPNLSQDGVGSWGRQDSMFDFRNEQLLVNPIARDSPHGLYHSVAATTNAESSNGNFLPAFSAVITSAVGDHFTEFEDCVPLRCNSESFLTNIDGRNFSDNVPANDKNDSTGYCNKLAIVESCDIADLPASMKVQSKCQIVVPRGARAGLPTYSGGYEFTAVSNGSNNQLGDTESNCVYFIDQFKTSTNVDHQHSSATPITNLNRMVSSVAGGVGVRPGDSRKFDKMIVVSRNENAALNNKFCSSHVRNSSDRMQIRNPIQSDSLMYSDLPPIKIRVEGAKKYYHCPYCAKFFVRPSDLVRHTRIHREDKPYKCHLCPVGFATRGNLMGHVATHDPEKLGQSCPVCHKVFARNWTLHNHLRKHSANSCSVQKFGQTENSQPGDATSAGSGPRHQCPICSRKYRKESRLRKHVDLVHGHNSRWTPAGRVNIRGTNRAGGAPTRLGREYYNPWKQHPDGRITLSDAVVEKKGELEDSVPNNSRWSRTNRMGQKFKCAQCPLAFRYRHHMEDHVRAVHKRLKQFRCQVCQKSFQKFSNMKLHLRTTHVGIRSHPCRLCQKSFATGSQLRRHATIHSDSMPFICPYCDRRFKRGTVCRSHIKKHNVDEILDHCQRQAEQRLVEASAAAGSGDGCGRGAYAGSHADAGTCKLGTLNGGHPEASYAGGYGNDGQAYVNFSECRASSGCRSFQQSVPTNCYGQSSTVYSQQHRGGKHIRNGDNGATFGIQSRSVQHPLQTWYGPPHHPQRCCPDSATLGNPLGYNECNQNVYQSHNSGQPLSGGQQHFIVNNQNDSYCQSACNVQQDFPHKIMDPSEPARGLVANNASGYYQSRDTAHEYAYHQQPQPSSFVAQNDQVPFHQHQYPICTNSALQLRGHQSVQQHYPNRVQGGASELSFAVGGECIGSDHFKAYPEINPPYSMNASYVQINGENNFVEGNEPGAAVYHSYYPSGGYISDAVGSNNGGASAAAANDFTSSDHRQNNCSGAPAHFYQYQDVAQGFDRPQHDNGIFHPPAVDLRDSSAMIRPKPASPDELPLKLSADGGGGEATTISTMSVCHRSYNDGFVKTGIVHGDLSAGFDSQPESQFNGPAGTGYVSNFSDNELAPTYRYHTDILPNSHLQRRFESTSRSHDIGIIDPLESPSSSMVDFVLNSTGHVGGDQTPSAGTLFDQSNFLDLPEHLSSAIADLLNPDTIASLLPNFSEVPTLLPSEIPDHIDVPVRPPSCPGAFPLTDVDSTLNLMSAADIINDPETELLSASDLLKNSGISINIDGGFSRQLLFGAGSDSDRPPGDPGAPPYATDLETNLDLRCHDCGMDFSCPEHLKDHQRRRHPYKFLDAPKSGKSIKFVADTYKNSVIDATDAPGSVLAEEIIPTEKFLLECKICAKNFETSSDLLCHESLHEKSSNAVPPVAKTVPQCPICGRVYTRKSSVFRHMRHVHNCDGETYTNSKSLAFEAGGSTIVPNGFGSLSSIPPLADVTISSLQLEELPESSGCLLPERPLSNIDLALPNTVDAELRSCHSIDLALAPVDSMFAELQQIERQACAGVDAPGSSSTGSALAQNNATAERFELNLTNHRSLPDRLNDSASQSSSDSCGLSEFLANPSVTLIPLAPSPSTLATFVNPNNLVIGCAPEVAPVNQNALRVCYASADDLQLVGGGRMGGPTSLLEQGGLNKSSSMSSLFGSFGGFDILGVGSTPTPPIIHSGGFSIDAVFGDALSRRDLRMEDLRTPDDAFGNMRSASPALRTPDIVNHIDALSRQHEERIMLQRRQQQQQQLHNQTLIKNQNNCDHTNGATQLVEGAGNSIAKIGAVLNPDVKLLGSIHLNDGSALKVQKNAQISLVALENRLPVGLQSRSISCDIGSSVIPSASGIPGFGQTGTGSQSLGTDLSMNKHNGGCSASGGYGASQGEDVCNANHKSRNCHASNNVDSKTTIVHQNSQHQRDYAGFGFETNKCTDASRKGKSMLGLSAGSTSVSDSVGTLAPIEESSSRPIVGAIDIGPSGAYKSSGTFVEVVERISSSVVPQNNCSKQQLSGLFDESATNEEEGDRLVIDSDAPESLSEPGERQTPTAGGGRRRTSRKSSSRKGVPSRILPTIDQIISAPLRQSSPVSSGSQPGGVDGSFAEGSNLDSFLNSATAPCHSFDGASSSMHDGEQSGADSGVDVAPVSDGELPSVAGSLPGGRGFGDEEIVGNESAADILERIKGTSASFVDGKVPCIFCSKTFRKPNDLERHLRCHTGEKPYQCHLCSRAFRLKSTCQSHIKTHTATGVPRPEFPCNFCDRKFVSANSLHVHTRIHTNETPLVCPDCPERFRTHASRKSHRRRCHGVGRGGAEGGGGEQDDPIILEDREELQLADGAAVVSVSESTMITAGKQNAGIFGGIASSEDVDDSTRSLLEGSENCLREQLVQKDTLPGSARYGSDANSSSFINSPGSNSRGADEPDDDVDEAGDLDLTLNSQKFLLESPVAGGPRLLVEVIPGKRIRVSPHHEDHRCSKKVADSMDPNASDQQKSVVVDFDTLVLLSQRGLSISLPNQSLDCLGSVSVALSISAATLLKHLENLSPFNATLNGDKAAMSCNVNDLHSASNQPNSDIVRADVAKLQSSDLFKFDKDAATSDIPASTCDKFVGEFEESNSSTLNTIGISDIGPLENDVSDPPFPAELPQPTTEESFLGECIVCRKTFGTANLSDVHFKDNEHLEMLRCRIIDEITSNGLADAAAGPALSQTHCSVRSHNSWQSGGNTDFSHAAIPGNKSQVVISSESLADSGGYNPKLNAKLSVQISENNESSSIPVDQKRQFQSEPSQTPSAAPTWIHQGTVAHHCKCCARRFPDKSTLKQHLVIHTYMPDSDGLSCGFCSRTFQKPGSLKNHITRKHRKTGVDHGKVRGSEKPLYRVIILDRVTGAGGGDDRSEPLWEARK